ncbi:Smr/MutS family protein [Porphyromonas levii]|uniref:Smr/MutS family protein n=1 Tax=Porphyromonas levii TaxID=28114 RepID=UPI001B8CC603|nr:DUF2027 domain-containing protein [Porphyromonas levii]MBR8713506.1 hypothetical protein [Porphyromonas levii]MBR8715525.1 hypothetical protein [Porphyromonas levii]MBR8728065.1 hypothetical protein [Porphyromonas levii]MBR8736401.1 hypothetical protein [Porphyromonas levii]MBR8778416.1 hypothetical protein [Porphyromonas levii]
MDIQVNIGDRVRFLNTTGGGIVRKVLRSSGVVYVEDESGFEIPVLHNEVVKVEDGATIVPPVSAKKQEAPATTAVQPQRKSTYRPAPKRGSDPSGELLNITLCYLPEEGGRIGQSHYEVFLVNDSNYDLFVTYTSGRGAAHELRFAGMISFDSSELLESFSPDELPERAKSTFQIIAFKEEGVPYRPKHSVDVELKIDGAKFFKENAFIETPYFDDHAIVYELVKDDKVMTTNKIDAEKLAAEMMSQKVATQQKRPHTEPQKKLSEPLVIDLHIDEVVDSTVGLEPRDMLELQLKRVEEVLRAHRKPSFKGKKIIFIHGKGEGVLRQAVINLLKRKYPIYDQQDASFQQYGFGATQVTIR